MKGHPRLDRARSTLRRFGSIPRRAALLGLGALCGALLTAARGEAYTAFAPVSPDVSANPIHVVIWVRDSVSAPDMADTVADIEAGLALWEGVPTSDLSFDTDVVQSATEPATALEDLLVIVAYTADLTQGGASLPFANQGCTGFPPFCPGTWFGAAADFPGSNFPLVAAHEIGHTLGLGHSTLGTLEFSTNIPIMHWALAGVAGLTADDAALVSHMYPSTTTPLGSATGTITGRLVSQSTGLPITGINAVAVDATTGDPSVAHLSGATFSLSAAAVPGAFHLIGLPPGVSTEVRLLDGRSFAGIGYGISELAFQADNFTSATVGPFVPSAGTTIALGDVAVAIEPVSIDRIGLGPDPDPGDLDPDGLLLPPGSVGEEWEVYLHLRGGVRPLDVTSFDLPPGFTPLVVTNRPNSAAPHGDTLLYLHGVPSFVGAWLTPTTLTDAHAVAAGTPGFVLPATDPCAPALGADADADGVCDDGAGNGTPVDQPCAGGQTLGCDDNCRFVPNPAQLDADTDGDGDACDGPGTLLIDFETRGDGTPLPPSIASIALGAFVDLGLRVSPTINNLGAPFKAVNNGYLSTPDPSGFAGHYVSKPSNSKHLQLTLNPPVTDVEFDWATHDEVRVIGRDELGQTVVDTVIPGTTTVGPLDAGHAVLNPSTPIASLQIQGPLNWALWIDNLELTQTGCAIGLDPDGNGTCATEVPIPEPDQLALLIAGGALLAALHRRRERRIAAAAPR